MITSKKREKLFPYLYGETFCNYLKITTKRLLLDTLRWRRQYFFLVFARTLIARILPRQGNCAAVIIIVLAASDCIYPPAPLHFPPQHLRQTSEKGRWKLINQIVCASTHLSPHKLIKWLPHPLNHRPEETTCREHVRTLPTPRPPYPKHIHRYVCMSVHYFVIKFY